MKTVKIRKTWNINPITKIKNSKKIYSRKGRKGKIQRLTKLKGGDSN